MDNSIAPTLSPDLKPDNNDLKAFVDSAGNNAQNKTEKEDMKKMRPKKSKIIKVIGFIVLGLLVITIGVAISACIWYKTSLGAVHIDDAATLVDFTIEEGQSTDQILNSLEEQNLIKSALAARIYLYLEGRNLILHSGSYKIGSSMTTQEILSRFNVGSLASTFTITFLPGGTVADAKKRIAAAGYSDEEIEAAFSKDYDHPLLKSKPASATLEGYIYGDTYEFYSTASVEEILTRAFDQMYDVITDNGLEAKYQAQGFTLHEGIVLASIIQRESGTLPDDMSTVAQVFIKRLKNNIVLGSDAIIAYRADQLNPNRDKTDMSYLTTVECPWNSRRCTGLPPTGISNPGKSALIAAGNPANTNYLYFLTGDDGKMHYAKTESEHNQNAKKYCQVLCGYL